MRETSNFYLESYHGDEYVSRDSKVYIWELEAFDIRGEEMHWDEVEWWNLRQVCYKKYGDNRRLSRVDRWWIMNKAGWKIMATEEKE